MKTSGLRRVAGLRMAVLATMVVALVAGVGCASGGPQTPWRSANSAPEVVNPWQLDPRSLPSQRLFRVHYEGPEGDFGFKLILYLERADRFRFQAADTLGRRLWVLRVGDGRRALWIDHRQETYCWADAERGLDFIPLSRMPVDAFPRLLLGRMPAMPADDLREAEDRVSYLDARGRTWVGTLTGQDLRSWSLLEAGEPIVWWRRTDEGGRPSAVFSDRRGKQQVRWREVIAEPLVGGIVADSIPPDYREVPCGESR